MATWLATQVPAAGLIIEAAYTSIPEVGAGRFPFLPVKQLASIQFPTAERIGTLHMPVLIMHTPLDEAIPFWMGQRLYALARAPKRFVTLAGHHNDPWIVDRDHYFSEFRRFLLEVRPQADEQAPAQGGTKCWRPEAR